MEPQASTDAFVKNSSTSERGLASTPLDGTIAHAQEALAAAFLAHCAELAVLVAVIGALVAAVVPLQESYVVLYNSAERTEIRLGTRQGHAREPSNVPTRQHAWLVVCAGGFEAIPHDLCARQGRQAHHYAVAAALVAVVARVAAMATGIGA